MLTPTISKIKPDTIIKQNQPVQLVDPANHSIGLIVPVTLQSTSLLQNKKATNSDLPIYVSPNSVIVLNGELPSGFIDQNIKLELNADSQFVNSQIINNNGSSHYVKLNNNVLFDHSSITFADQNSNQLAFITNNSYFHNTEFQINSLKNVNNNSINIFNSNLESTKISLSSGLELIESILNYCEIIPNNPNLVTLVHTELDNVTANNTIQLANHILALKSSYRNTKHNLQLNAPIYALNDINPARKLIFKPGTIIENVSAITDVQLLINQSLSAK